MPASCVICPTGWQLTERDQMKGNASGGALCGWEVTFMWQLSSFSACGCPLKRDEGECSCLLGTRQADEKLPYGSLPQEKYTSFKIAYLPTFWEDHRAFTKTSETEFIFVASVDTCNVIGHICGAVSQHLAKHMERSGARITLHSGPEWAEIPGALYSYIHQSSSERFTTLGKETLQLRQPLKGPLAEGSLPTMLPAAVATSSSLKENQNSSSVSTTGVKRLFVLLTTLCLLLSNHFSEPYR